ncbi:hypothetical protein DFH27DRAFT_559328 [Peziza echinospora]|nr:hypothetical protein DFH27DRAFT_559328 [Peziza echinospora]
MARGQRMRGMRAKIRLVKRVAWDAGENDFVEIGLTRALKLYSTTHDRNSIVLTKGRRNYPPLALVLGRSLGPVLRGLAAWKKSRMAYLRPLSGTVKGSTVTQRDDSRFAGVLAARCLPSGISLPPPVRCAAHPGARQACMEVRRALDSVVFPHPLGWTAFKRLWLFGIRYEVENGRLLASLLVVASSLVSSLSSLSDVLTVLP